MPTKGKVDGGVPDVQVDDVGAATKRAAKLGAEVLGGRHGCRDFAGNFFWGERYGLLRDPFGHQWALASRIEDLSPRQIQERANAFYNRDRS
jgi:uncharacterized glyoxalase superfamily protein PhnB